MKNNLFKSLLVATGISVAAFKAQAAFTYEGTLVDPSGNVVTSNSVQFILEVMSPGAEACVLYKESQSLDMTSSEGYFSLNVGAGTVMGSYPAFNRIFLNHGTMNGLACGSGATYYSPAYNDIRKLRVTVVVGGGAAEVLGTLTIHPVPMAETSRTVGAFEAQSLLRAVDATSNPTNIPPFTPAQMTELTNLIAGSSTLYAPPGGGGGGSPTGNAGGDLVGTYPNPVLGNSGVVPGVYGSPTQVPSISVNSQGRVTNVSLNSIMGLLPAPGGNGDYLRSNGTMWIPANIKFDDIKNSVGASAFSTAGCAANKTVNWSSLTDSFQCQAIGGLDASTITSGMLPPSRMGGGSPMTTTFLRGNGQWMSPFGSLPANRVPRWDGSALVGSAIYDDGANVGIGTNAPATTLSVAGAIQIGNDGGMCNVGREGAIRFNSGVLEICNGSVWGAVGGGPIPESTGSANTANFAGVDTIVFSSASAGVITLNGLNPGFRKTLIITSTSAGTYTFSGSCSTSVYNPANSAVSATSKVIYNIYRPVNTSLCFIDWKIYY